MKNKPVTLIILLGLLALVAVFLTVDFNLSRSETTSEHQLTTISQGSGLITAAPLEQGIIVAVVGKGAFAEKLREALLTELSASRLAAHGHWVVATDDSRDALHLLVRVDNSDIFWTPVFAQATLDTTLGYASDHDLTWYGTLPISMENKDDASVLWADGKFHLSDRSSGLLSWPAYQRIMAEKMASTMVQSLQNIYTQGG